MKKWQFMALVLSGLIGLGAASCGSKPVTSLCRLDVTSRMCWTDEEHSIGFTFEQIHQMTQGNNPMWCVDTFDLRRIQRKLSQCRAE